VPGHHDEKERGDNMVDMKGMMRKAAELQTRLASMQAELAGRTVEATSGGGMVKATVNGAQELVSVTINPEVLGAGADPEMVEDLVVAAVNEGIKRSKEMVSTELAKITGGLPFPGLS
jgi:hypothetical protein